MRTHDDYGVGFQHGGDGFFAVAHQVNVHVGFNRGMSGKGAKSALCEGQGHVRLIERKWIGDDFYNQQADSRREAVRQLCGCLQSPNCFRESGVEDDYLNRSLDGYDGSDVRGHDSSVSGRR
jgi:hypothetical protein